MKRTLKFHLMLFRMTKIKNTSNSLDWRGCETRRALLHCLRKFVQPLWKSVYQFLKIFEINLLQKPAIPILGKYHKDTCSAISIAALFIIVRNQKQPRCPTAAEWIKKIWYIFHSVVLLSCQKQGTRQFEGKQMELGKKHTE